jgi:hypothetical protein
MTIPVEECRKCLPECDLSDEKIMEIRDSLEAITQNILDNLFDQGIGTEETRGAENE